MLIEFFIPIDVKKYNPKKETYEKATYEPCSMLEAIEEGLRNDLSWPVVDENYSTLDYKLIGSGTRNLTFRGGKLYICLKIEVELPTFNFKYSGEEHTFKRPDHSNFEKFLKHIIDEINGDMGDGWGEGWEQREFTYNNEKWSPTSGNVEFVKWCGLGLSKKTNEIIKTVYYADSKKNDLNLNDGWVNDSSCSREGDNFASSVRSAAETNLFLSKLQGFAPPNHWEKRIQSLFTKYQVTKNFVKAYINFFIDMVNKGIFYSNRDEVKTMKKFGKML